MMQYSGLSEVAADFFSHQYRAFWATLKHTSVTSAPWLPQILNWFTNLHLQSNLYVQCCTAPFCRIWGKQVIFLMTFYGPVTGFSLRGGWRLKWLSQGFYWLPKILSCSIQYRIYSRHLDNSPPYLFQNFNKYNLVPIVVFKNLWMTGKQCRPKWDAAFCGISSGSTLFAHARLSS